MYNFMRQSLQPHYPVTPQKIFAREISAANIMDRVLDLETRSEMDKYSRYTPAAISIKNLLDHGQNSTSQDSFLFLKKEIPTRLANMIMEIRLLPPELLSQRECADILDDYLRSFGDMIVFQNASGSSQDFERFNSSLNVIRKRHLDTVPLMAQAVRRLYTQTQTASEGVSAAIQYFLDRLYTNRISIHMLICHYNALLGAKKNIQGMVGTIEPECDLLAECRRAYVAASDLCDMEYLHHPQLRATAMDTTDNDIETQKTVTASVVPSHLHHILFEIFKNSMRATCENAERKNMMKLPYIKCKIYKTEDDITIKISDLGGGIKRESREKVFNYMYSTAPKVAMPVGGSYGGLAMSNIPMHGLGYGLPLSRLYARYFRGDISISSVDGYGTDVYVYLQRLSHMAQENLPVYNKHSSAKLQSIGTQVPDWTPIRQYFGL